MYICDGWDPVCPETHLSPEAPPTVFFHSLFRFSFTTAFIRSHARALVARCYAPISCTFSPVVSLRARARGNLNLNGRSQEWGSYIFARARARSWDRVSICIYRTREFRRGKIEWNIMVARSKGEEEVCVRTYMNASDVGEGKRRFEELRRARPDAACVCKQRSMMKRCVLYYY